MAARPTWQGHLKLSLVTCPVALFTATAATKTTVPRKVPARRKSAA